MLSPYPSFSTFRASFVFILFIVFLMTVWIAGGASRPDVLGQAVVRGVASALCILTLLFGPRPSFSQGRLGLILLVAALVVVLAQLVPLPPGLWQALPGRALLSEAAALSGQSQPWRPWSIAPGGTVNACMSLIVPFATLLLFAQMSATDRTRIPGLLLISIAGAMVVGLLQFSSTSIENPLINPPVGIISGTLANRNHFALLLAIGCLMAPVWAFSGSGHAPPRAMLAAGLVLLFFLAILVTGSRAGLLLGPIGVVLGLLISARAVRQALRHRARLVFPALIAGIFCMIAVCVVLAVLAGRAESIDRFVLTQGEQEMRLRGLPVVLEMIGTYFPSGGGAGSFDPLFRIREPLALLKPTYFNQAHNDFLDVMLSFGLPGLLLLLAALAWWVWASIEAWHNLANQHSMLPPLGSAVLLLVAIASIFDYPARTPLMMVMVVIAAAWLSSRSVEKALPALPESGLDL